MIRSLLICGLMSAAVIGCNESPSRNARPSDRSKTGDKPEPDTRGVESREVMKQQLSQLVPPGTSIQKAQQVMEREGFSCSQKHNTGFSEEGVGHDNLDYIYCDRSDEVGPFTTRRWQIALIIEHSKVRGYLVSMGYRSP